ncbi:hypothetical protein GCK72_018858 [Caenorhabditis remanei]|uniref:Carboxylesterase type B domain-containing protein n=1 Tax=Caenorhabditis remanei TaxID=31234 RepID=A0A6A5GC88_CAERE|nr:hypothetical protein GCK72_018858 [Caenorhabditis remanei]KAF1752304.1 hypothetical protein GCK72_018858 [Caenorhabditis remanei]
MEKLKAKNCSVMIAVHGGQMLRGSPAAYSNEIITNNFVGQDRNIVVVTVPYRLGIFGLPNLPGELEGIADRNLILYDVIEGLQWVKREISSFGGDSNRMTYFGHSGGATIGMMIGFLPEYDNLYQQVILMSTPLLMHSKLSNSKMFRKIAKRVGCFTSIDNQQIFDCMREISAEKLLSMQEYIFKNEEESFADFAIDGKMLQDNPRRLLESGNFTKKPLLIGTVPYELRYTRYFIGKEGNFEYDELLKMCELFGFVGAYEKPYSFVESCVEFYMKNETYEFLLDDYMFHVPAANLARHHASEQPVYLYSYKYPGVGSAYSSAPGIPNNATVLEGVPSPAHSEDFVYVMGGHRSPNFTEKDLNIEHLFTGIIANFVNSEAPNGQEWAPLNIEVMNYFDIDFVEKSDGQLTMSGMKYEFYKKQMEFWNEIVPQ